MTTFAHARESCSAAWVKESGCLNYLLQHKVSGKLSSAISYQSAAHAAVGRTATFLDFRISWAIFKVCATVCSSEPALCCARIFPKVATSSSGITEHDFFFSHSFSVTPTQYSQMAWQIWRDSHWSGTSFQANSRNYKHVTGVEPRWRKAEAFRNSGATITSLWTKFRTNWSVLFASCPWKIQCKWRNVGTGSVRCASIPSWGELRFCHTQWWLGFESLSSGQDRFLKDVVRRSLNVERCLLHDWVTFIMFIPVWHIRT